MPITMDDVSTVVYDPKFDLRELSPETRRFIEKARSTRNELILWRDLATVMPELYELEASLREIRPGDPRYGNPEETRKLQGNMGYLQAKTAEYLSDRLPKTQLVVSLQEGPGFDVVDLTRSTKELPNMLSLDFYSSGILTRKQWVTAEIYAPDLEDLSRTNKVTLGVPGDIRTYTPETIERQARYFATLIKDEIGRIL